MCIRDSPAFICNEVSFDPGILFVVLNPADRDNERVFWKYMSVNFLNSLDFTNNSTTISFQSEDEILNNEVSVLAFCKRLEEIVERHSFVKQLKRNTYSKEDVKRIIQACDEEITDSIDRLDVLNKNRDNVSRRILTRLDDLCVSALLLNACLLYTSGLKQSRKASATSTKACCKRMPTRRSPVQGSISRLVCSLM